MAGPYAALLHLPTLVVEDDPGSASLVATLLADAGCEVRVAADAEEAFVALRTFPAGLIVLDLVLPRMSGLMLARELTRKPTVPGMVIVAVSVMEPEPATRLALQAGCDAFVAKPIDPATFVATVACHLKAPATLSQDTTHA